MVRRFSSRSRALKEPSPDSRSSQSASRSSWRWTGRTVWPSRAERVPWCWATQGSTWLRQWSPCERTNSSQTARTLPGLSGPFQLAGAGKSRSRVAGRSRRCKVAHKTGRSATTSTRSKRGSLGFILPFYPPPPFHENHPEHERTAGAIGPESLIVVALPQGKCHHRHLPAPCHGCIRGRVIEWRLLMVQIVFGAALEERLAQHG